MEEEDKKSNQFIYFINLFIYFSNLFIYFIYLKCFLDSSRDDFVII